MANRRVDARLLGANAKLKRALEHARELEREINAFIGREPYKLVSHHEANATRFSLEVREVLGLRCALLLGDVIHNLRSALDHTAVAAAKFNGANGKSTYFPISADQATFKNDGMKKIKATPLKFVQMVESLKPYKGGNDVLYALHQLDIADKHSILLPLVGAQASARACFYLGEPGQPDYREVGPPVFEMGQELFTAKEGKPAEFEGVIIAGPGIPAEAKLHLSMSFKIRFDEGSVAAGQEVLPTISEMGRQVLAIIEITHDTLFI